MVRLIITLSLLGVLLVSPAVGELIYWAWLN